MQSIKKKIFVLNPEYEQIIVQKSQKKICKPTSFPHCMFACWWLIALMSEDRQTDRKIDGLTERHRVRETYRQSYRQTDRQTVPIS